jgi:hydroxyacylglutathione hydrolase
VPVSLELEHATNPFLRIDTPALRKACRDGLGSNVADDRVARFAWLRLQKDGFRAPA